MITLAIRTHKDRCKEKKENPCTARCPFDNERFYECMPCADLFPVWAENWMDENHFRTFGDLSDGPDCPCYTLGAEFVAWRIEYFLNSGK